MSMYKTRDLVALFDVTGETIRTWSMEFAAYLSPTAQPGAGRQRFYTDDDLTVLSLVAAMKAEGKVFDDIHAALKTGQRGDLVEVVTPHAEDLDDAGQLAYVRQKLSTLQRERDDAVERAQELHDEVIRLKTRLEMYEEQRGKIDDLHRQIAELHRQIGRLEAGQGD